jgi:vacuolar-type H+-ATPase subunit H
MATATKTQTDAIQDATAQAQELTERLVEATKKAANEYLTLTEKAAESVVGIQRQVAEQTEVEWLSSLIEAQARFTGDVTKVFVSSGRELLK